MTEQNSPETPPATPDAPPAQQTPPPVQTPPPTPPAPQSPPQNDSGLAEIRAELAALPERLTNSLREALAPPKTPEPPKTADTPPAGDPKPGKREYASFAHRWFGVPKS